LNIFEPVASANVRFRSRLRIIGRLGQERDVVLLHDAEPHAVATRLKLVAQRDPATPGVYGLPLMTSRVWSLYGAPWLQLVANSGKSRGLKKGRNKPNRLPEAATGCVWKYMVSRTSAVGCHPLREVPSLKRRGSTRQYLLARALLLVAVRTRTLVASTAGACLTNHAVIVSAKQSAGESAVLRRFGCGRSGVAWREPLRRPCREVSKRLFGRRSRFRGVDDHLLIGIGVGGERVPVE
jgi:hypothetical protein